jgi:predicted nuclease of predicted toxin-antitoxin system
MSEVYKLYLDQMFRVDVAQALIAEGHDVLRASEIQQSRHDDQQVLERAISENRILITLDEHFGDWTILPLSRHPGVIRIKVHPTTSKKVLNLLSPFLERHNQDRFRNHLVILSERRAKWVFTG